MEVPSNEEYAAAVEDLTALGRAANGIISDLVAQSDMVLHTLNWRVKTKQSADRKLLASPTKYAGYSDLHDMLGIRIITLFEDDLPAAERIVRDVLSIDEEASGDRGAKYRPTEFGYRSRHFIGELGPDRVALPENKRFAARTIEVQLRSILQHAWAEIEHDLGYKPQRPVSDELRRRFGQLAALIELADEQFTFLRRVLLAGEAEAKEDSLDLVANERDYFDAAHLAAFVMEDPSVGLLDQKVAGVFGGVVLPPGKRYRVIVGNLIDACLHADLRSLSDVSQAVATYGEQVVRLAKTLASDPDSKQLAFEFRPGFSIFLIVRLIVEGESIQ